MNHAWTRLSHLTPEALRTGLAEAHWALQIIAAAGQNFAEAQDDDSHRATTWDGDRGALVSAPFAGAYPFRVGLRLDDMTLHMLDRTEESLGVLSLPGKSLDDAYVWLASAVANYSGSLPEIARPEYDMPPHPIADGRAFGPLDEGAGVVSALYRTSADFLDELVAPIENAAPVRCWPHHFDIATLLSLGEERTIGVGMAPFGGGYDDWYWYVSPYPFPGPDAVPELDGPGSWHFEGWTGVVLPGAAVTAADADFRLPLLRKYVDRSLVVSKNALGV